MNQWKSAHAANTKARTLTEAIKGADILFGLSAKASGFPVEFVYPKLTAIVPANVGIIANAKNPKAAEAFVEFLLSDEGQQILLDPTSTAAIRPFPITQVALGPGLLKEKQDRMVAFARNYDERKFLVLFNQLAGRPNPSGVTPPISTSGPR